MKQKFLKTTKVIAIHMAIEIAFGPVIGLFFLPHLIYEIHEIWQNE